MASMTATDIPTRATTVRTAAPVRTRTTTASTDGPMFGNAAVFERLQGKRKKSFPWALLAVPAVALVGGAILLGTSGNGSAPTQKIDSVTSSSTMTTAAKPAPAPLIQAPVEAAPAQVAQTAPVAAPAPVRAAPPARRAASAPASRTLPADTPVIRAQTPAPAPAAPTGIDTSAPAAAAPAAIEPLAPVTPIAPSAPQGGVGNDAAAAPAAPGAEVQ